ncbi:MAG: 7-cyano-7-deazaguanine reductase [Acidimicrobiales bacterium]|nr:7-cyano-7-deazaguanine reductase [Acidimicrobiales bacterium]
MSGEHRPALLGRNVEVSEYGQLDTFPADPAQTWVELSGDELTALCPAVSGLQPDLYRWSIRYEPNERCLESKSLKLYLLTFRDERIFAEHLAGRIARDLAATLDTEVTVRLHQNRRGGIETAVEAVAGTRRDGAVATTARPELNPGG